MKTILCIICLLSLVSCGVLTDAKDMVVAEKVCQQNGGVVNISQTWLRSITAYPLDIWCANGAKFEADRAGHVFRDFTKKPLTEEKQ